MSKIKALILLTLSMTCWSCAYETPSVKILDDDRIRIGHCNKPDTRFYYLALAEQVTDTLLNSRIIQPWTKRHPRLVVNKLLNNSGEEIYHIEDIYDQILETILKSGLVKLMDNSVKKKTDYILRPELTLLRQYDDNGRQLTFYKLEHKLYTSDDVLVGKWSDASPQATPKPQQCY